MTVFGIIRKGATSQPILPEQFNQNVKKVHGYIKSIIGKEEETNQLRKDSTMNGPEGSVSQKISYFIELWKNGVNSLIRKIAIINIDYKDNVDWQALLTTQIEDLLSVSHFSHISSHGYLPSREAKISEE